jgi:hypothetical protein
MLSLQREKKTKTKKTQNKNKTIQNKKFPSSNAVHFQLVLQQPVLVLLLSHHRKRKTKQRVWRQLCECLSEAGAHLPHTVNHLLVQALFMQISGIALHSPSPTGFVYLEFWMHAPFVFYSVQP